MAILSDQEIWSLLESGRLKIQPSPAADAVSPSTIDLRLDNDFVVFKQLGGSAAETLIDTRDSKAAMNALADFTEKLLVPDGDYFPLKPGHFVLAWTRERVSMPNFLSARIEGRSTPARLGLSVHQSAPTVHPTFDNRLQLELTNAGPFTLKLFPGHSICQLIIETKSLPSVSSLVSVHQAPKTD